jgi:hypothetical protein
MANNGRQVTGWAGWVYFAGFLMVLMGIFEIINGLAALLNDKYFLVRNNNLVVFDYTTWGWIHLVLGIIVLMAGMAVINGRLWGRLFAVLLAILSFVANFTFIAAYPFWSVTIMTIDLFIIYALTVHGSETAE